MALTSRHRRWSHKITSPVRWNLIVAAAGRGESTKTNVHLPSRKPQTVRQSDRVIFTLRQHQGGDAQSPENWIAVFYAPPPPFLLSPLYLLFIFFLPSNRAPIRCMCVCVWDLVHFCFLFCRSDLLQFWTPGYRMFPLVGTQLCIMSRRFRGLFYTFCFKDNRCVGVFPPTQRGASFGSC